MADPKTLPERLEKLFEHLDLVEKAIVAEARMQGVPGQVLPPSKLAKRLREWVEGQLEWVAKNATAKAPEPAAEAVPPAPEPPPAPPPPPFEGLDIHSMCLDKRAYSSPEAAGRAANKAHRNGSTDRLRTYRCPFGNDHYHLTKRSLPES